MFILDCKKVLRNNRWKYGVVIAFVAYLYYKRVYNEELASMGLGLFSPFSHETLIVSIATLPMLLFLFLFYDILYQQESYAAWKTLLAYPVSQRRHLCHQMGIILLFQFPAWGIGMGCYWMMTHTIDRTVALFLLAYQSLYIVSYLLYRYRVKSGILSEGMNVSIVNPLKSLTPVFLAFCCMNTGDWFDVLASISGVMILLVCAVFAYLIHRCNDYMEMKLHRELLLLKLFSGTDIPQIAYSKQKQKGQLDKIMQSAFQILPFQSRAYWQIIASLEVSIKQKGYPLIVSICAFVMFLTERKWIYGCIIPIVLSYFCLFYKKQKQKIHFVYIHS